MANDTKKDEHLQMLNTTVVALVALVAIVGVTAILLNKQLAASDAVIPAEPDENVIGESFYSMPGTGPLNQRIASGISSSKTCKKDVTDPDDQRTCIGCVELGYCYNQLTKDCDTC